MKKNKRKKRHAFTLVEITLVIMLILSLITAVFVGSRAFINATKKVRCVLNADRIGKEIQGACLQNGISKLEEIDVDVMEDILGKTSIGHIREPYAYYSSRSHVCGIVRHNYSSTSDADFSKLCPMAARNDSSYVYRYHLAKDVSLMNYHQTWNLPIPSAMDFKMFVFCNASYTYARDQGASGDEADAVTHTTPKLIDDGSGPS